jgi:ABC-type spermidine/putrescine transport system permease subunit II
MSSITEYRSGGMGWRWAGRIFLVFLLGFTIMPMAWMLITSLKTGFAAMQYPPQWWPTEPTLDNYWRLLAAHQRASDSDFLRYMSGTAMWVSIATTVLGVASSRCRRPTPSRGSASPGTQPALLLGAAAQHVPGGGVPRCRCSS